MIWFFSGHYEGTECNGNEGGGIRKQLLTIKQLLFSPLDQINVQSTMFENYRKSLIQHCERSELRLHFEWTKSSFKCQK